MAFTFPSPAQDGQIVEVIQNDDGTKFVYRYNESQNTWELKGQGLDLDTNNIIIYTNDVVSRTGDPRPDPVGPPAAYALDPNDIDFSKLTDQRIINWTLNDAIQELFRLDEETIYFGDSPPVILPDDPSNYKFWWDTERLELTIWYNDQWWPVSIPPAQAEALRQEIDALYQDTATNRLNIAITQQELDTKVLETKERIDVVEETANTAKDTADDAKTAADAATVAAGNAAQLDQNNSFSSSNTNTFNGPVESKKVISVKSPASNSQDPNFEILGTSRTGTANSKVLYTFNSGSPTRLQARYRGPMVHDDEIVTKKYVDDSRGPAFHKWIFKPTTDKNDLNPGEFTGPRQPTYGNGTHYSYYFHPESLTGEMEFYKDYNMYFPMNALWGAFHYLNGSKWRLKQYVPVRDIKMFYDDNYLEIYTHTDYPTGGETIAGFDTDREYYFAIGGLI